MRRNELNAVRLSWEEQNHSAVQEMICLLLNAKHSLSCSAWPGSVVRAQSASSEYGLFYFTITLLCMHVFTALYILKA
jgi:hypothetical protein